MLSLRVFVPQRKTRFWMAESLHCIVFCHDIYLCVCRWETDGRMPPIPACHSTAVKRVFRLRLQSAPQKTVRRYYTPPALLLQLITVTSYKPYSTVITPYYCISHQLKNCFIMKIYSIYILFYILSIQYIYLNYKLEQRKA